MLINNLIKKKHCDIKKLFEVHLLRLKFWVEFKFGPKAHKVTLFSSRHYF